MKAKIAYLLIGFLFLVLNLTPVPKYLRSTTFSIISPAIKIINWSYLNTANFFTSFSNTRALIQENETLRSQVYELERDLLVINEGKENISLEKFYTEYYGYSPDSVLTANVLEFYTREDGRYITLNKGEKDGVIKGNNIVVQSTLLGLVQTTSINTSSVKLIDSPNTQVPVKVSGKNTFGSFSCAQNCMVEKIPAQDDIEVGDLLITSGVNGVYIPSLSIGLVTSVNDEPTSAFRSANVSYQIMPSKLYKVVVLLAND